MGKRIVLPVVALAIFMVGVWTGVIINEKLNRIVIIQTDIPASSITKSAGKSVNRGEGIKEPSFPSSEEEAIGKIQEIEDLRHHQKSEQKTVEVKELLASQNAYQATQENQKTRETHLKRAGGDNIVIYNGKVLHLKYDEPYFEKVVKMEFNPTMEEMRRFDRIIKRLQDPSTSPLEREKLKVELEELKRRATRPCVHIRGVLITKEPEKWHNVNWQDEYYRRGGE